MYVAAPRFGPLARQVPPAPPTPFDKAVHAQRAATVAAVRTSAAAEALAFLQSPPTDPAKPLGRAGKI